MPAAELILRGFWLLAAGIAGLNYLMLRGGVVTRLAELGVAAREAARLWSWVCGASATLGLALFSVQALSHSPTNPLLPFRPTEGFAGLAAFGTLLAFYLANSLLMWLHPKGPLLASAWLQGFVGPPGGRYLLTLGPILGMAALLLLMRDAA